MHFNIFELQNRNMIEPHQFATHSFKKVLILKTEINH